MIIAAFLTLLLNIKRLRIKLNANLRVEYTLSKCINLSIIHRVILVHFVLFFFLTRRYLRTEYYYLLLWGFKRQDGSPLFIGDVVID